VESSGRNNILSIYLLIFIPYLFYIFIYLYTSYTLRIALFNF